MNIVDFREELLQLLNGADGIFGQTIHVKKINNEIEVNFLDSGESFRVQVGYSPVGIYSDS